ncbi:hypothetical protein FRC11_007964 [Ceratobasidium sp. 423]|nr:hypothetical protein FRC11_007964 [Ceratobasidium sp. 423]
MRTGFSLLLVVQVYTNDYYYLTTTTGRNIQITRAKVSYQLLNSEIIQKLTDNVKSVGDLKTATPKIIWNDTMPDPQLWAPEIHRLHDQGPWYIYYTSGAQDKHIHVIKGSSNDIWESTWSHIGRIVVPNHDDWAIDATVMNHTSGLYLAFSGHDEAKEQCIWIAKMDSPTSVGNATMISRPSNDWERIGPLPVNEGPAPLSHNGRTWLFYSASHCDGNAYSLGRLELTGSDPLSPEAWKKHDAGPVFSEANGSYSVGHNGFLTMPSGNVYNVYHASPSLPAHCNGDRRTMFQGVSWDDDGTPNLGSPAPLSEDIPEPV